MGFPLEGEKAEVKEKMYLSQPVRIPAVRGKITLRKKGDATYVQYQLSRTYDPNVQYSRVERSEIGVQIPGRPELMLPNENYLQFFPEGGREMSNEEREQILEYSEERDRYFMLNEFFNQLFLEFQMISRKRPTAIVNENQVRRINRVLVPLMEMMKDEAYAGFLESIPEPEVHDAEDGQRTTTGMSYSDVSLLLTQFKGALNRFFQKRR